MKRVSGLDSIRLILVIIVILTHGTLPYIPMQEENTLLQLVNGIIANSFVGVAAVIGFFVISGFVIHYPYTDSQKLNIAEFYAKRFIRIAFPAFIAYLLYRYTFNQHLEVIWSLICEVIYYGLYPFILKFKEKYFQKMLILSFAVSYLVSLFYSTNSSTYNGDFHRNGYAVTWLVGLPVWLLGVALADTIRNPKNEYNFKFQKLYLLRISTWLASFISSVLRFHAEISYVYTLPIFSILVFYWLKEEIYYFKTKKENRLMAYGGKISYSIYLMHLYCIYIIEFKVYKSNDLKGNVWACMAAISLSLFVSLIFYIFVEKPSHKLARSIHSLS